MDVCTGGLGTGVSGGESRLGIEDSLMGFAGGVFILFCFSGGGGGGANLGCSGTLRGGGLEIGNGDVEPLKKIEGGFGGATGGGFKKERSSSSIDGNGKGVRAGMEG